MAAVFDYDPRERPPAGLVYCLYFPSGALKTDVAKEIEGTFRAIEGEAAFDDLDGLARNVERLAILFAAPESEIRHAMRERRLNQLLRTLARGAGYLRNLTATFSVFGFAMKIGFDQSGTTVTAEPKNG